MRLTETSYVTATGVVFSGRGLVYDVLIGTDATNDPEITMYDGNSATNTKQILPTNTYDASQLGLNGYSTSIGTRVNNGCYIVITCGGTCEVIIKWERL